MKKLSSYFTIMMLAAMVLTSCAQKQAKTEEEFPLKVTYSIDCSDDLLNLCDLVVSYKGEDGANTIDTITANPSDSTGRQLWTKVVATHKVPVKIGIDYNFVPKTDTLILDHPTALLDAKCTIIAEKMGLKKRSTRISERVITKQINFFMEYSMIHEDVKNTRNKLATTIEAYNSLQAENRGSNESNTCFIIKPSHYDNVMEVKKTSWNDDSNL